MLKTAETRETDAPQETSGKMESEKDGSTAREGSPDMEKSSSEGSPELEKVTEEIHGDDEDEENELDVIWEARASENSHRPRRRRRRNQGDEKAQGGDDNKGTEDKGENSAEEGSGDGKSSTPTPDPPTNKPDGDGELTAQTSLRGSSVVVKNSGIGFFRGPPNRRTERLMRNLHYELDRIWGRVKGPMPTRDGDSSEGESVDLNGNRYKVHPRDRPKTGPAPAALYAPEPLPDQHVYVGRSGKAAGGAAAQTKDGRSQSYPWGYQEQAFQIRPSTYKPAAGTSPRKAGPREIGRADGYQPPEYGVDLNDERARAVWRIKFLEPRWHIKSAVDTGARAQRKEGPVETGRNADFEMPEYGVELDPQPSSAPWNAGFKFLEPRWHVKSTPGKSPKKMGPREIGRSVGYEMPDYGVDIGPGELPKGQSWNYAFLEPRYHVKGAAGASPRKAGPREIGRNKDFEVPDYDVDIRPFKPQNSWNYQFLEPRYHAKSMDGGGGKSPKKEGPREIGRSIGYIQPDYGIILKPEAGGSGGWSSHFRFLEPRYDTRGQSTSGAKAPKKLGPVSIGYINDYKKAEYELDESQLPRGNSFLDPRPWSPRSKFAAEGSRAPSKVGPRETGRIQYEAYEHDFEDAAGGSFLQDRLSTSTRPTKEQKTALGINKAGPRDIGRFANYKSAEFEYEGAEGGSFLMERLPSSPRRPTQAEKTAMGINKPGPREIGRIQYDALEHDYDGAQGSDFLVERMDSPRKRITQEQKTALKKPGPREIGRNAKYDALEHNYEDATGGNFLNERLDSKSAVSHLPKQKSAKKLGPREIGRNNYDSYGSGETYHPPAQQEEEDVDFLEDRLSRFV